MQERLFWPQKWEQSLSTRQRAVSLGKGTTLPKREATQIRSYPESRSYTIPRRAYSNLKAGLKVKLNSTTMATFAFPTPSIKAVQNISESKPFHCRLTKTLKGVLLTLKKRQNSRIHLQPVWTMSNLSTSTKDKSKASWWPEARQQYGHY